MAKRRIKVYNKINLFEASVVGIPAYPDAHFSADSFSLIKSISNFSKVENEEVDLVCDITKLNTETKMGEIVSKETTEAVQKSEVTETKAFAIDANQLTEILKTAIKEGMKEMEVSRGLVSQEKSAEETIKSMSTGELALKMGLFQITK